MRENAGFDVALSQFSWDGDATYTADASDLGWPIGKAPDPSFLVSNSEGIPMEVAIVDVDKNSDYAGGWQALCYKPLPPFDKIKFVIFND
jgi:hypothetical protein